MVYKFGGSSVRDAKAIVRVAHLIAENPDVKIGVISATYNTTNRLEWVYQALLEGDEAKALERFEEVKNHHLSIFQDLCEHFRLSLEAQKHWQQQFRAQTFVPYLHFKCETMPQTLDFLYSFGEWVSSWLVSFTLKNLSLEREIQWRDARTLIITNHQPQKAEPLLEPMQKAADHDPGLFDSTLVITQGFIGKTLDGITTTLGREGSDYSATLLARLIKAKSVTIWTDVEGVASFDPRLMQNVLWHQFMSYEEAEFLATGGAKVLFPRTLAPVKDLKIPVIVRSSLHPQAGMTTIGDQKLTGFALALNDQNPAQVSFILNSVSDLPEFFKHYPDILEMKIDGKMGKFKVSSSIALELCRKIHADLHKISKN